MILQHPNTHFNCDIYVDLFLSFAFNNTEMTLVAFDQQVHKTKMM